MFSNLDHRLKWIANANMESFLLTAVPPLQVWDIEIRVKDREGRGSLQPTIGHWGQCGADRWWQSELTVESQHQHSPQVKKNVITLNTD